MSWIIIVTTILSLISGGGVVYASGDALPGDVLYPVKTWVEDVRLAVASDETDVGLHFHFAETRVEEILALIEEGDLDDLDEVVHGYENQVKLLTQTMAKIMAQDPEETIRLRTDLESKLQDQARKMEDVLENADEADLFLQERVRLMLQTNTELRQRINEEEEIPDEGVLPEEGETALEETEGEEQSPSGGEQNQQGKQDASLEVDDEDATFNFNLGGKGANGVYAIVEGTRFECSIDGDTATCPFFGVPENGNVALHDKQTNELLFTYAYEYAFTHEYSWQGEKNDNGGNGAQSGDGCDDKEMNHDGKEK